jgi:GNAT superfamily N-acetyltransferase
VDKARIGSLTDKWSRHASGPVRSLLLSRAAHSRALAGRDNIYHTNIMAMLTLSSVPAEEAAPFYKDFLAAFPDGRVGIHLQAQVVELEELCAGLTESGAMFRYAEGKWTIKEVIGHLLDTEVIVGTCGFKAPPDDDGVVEIAYFTFPDFEGRGCGSAMAIGLVERARRAVGVRRLRAHTLPERNASTRILEKAGFDFLGEVIDPEDGPVWRWERMSTR